MPHESCVSHATRNWYFHVRVDYFGITNGDHCAAALLYIFEYLTSTILEDMRGKEITGDPWISISKEHLSDAMVGLFSARSILTARTKLEEAGFISRRDQAFTRGACEYLLDYERVSARIAEWDASTAGKIARRKFNTYAGRIARDLETTSAELRTDTAQNCALLNKELKHCSKSISEENIKLLPLLSDQNLQNHPEASLEPETLQDSNPERPPATDSKYFESQSTSYELQLGESVEYFVQWMYKRKGKDIDATGKFIRGKLTSRANTPLREKLESFERKHGVEEFRTALHIYFETERPALETAHWPLNFFLHDILDYLPDAHSLPCRASHDELGATARPSGASARSETPPAAPALEDSHGDSWRKLAPSSVLTCVDRWNTVVSEVKCEKLLQFQIKSVEKILSDPDFSAVWEDILEKCRLISQYRPEDGKTFVWVFDGSFNGGNWKSLVNGRFDYMTRPRMPVTLSASDQALEEAARREREAEAEERGK